MTVYALDTHALAWYLFNPARLGNNALKIFEQAEKGEVILHVPLVVVAELSMVVERGRVNATPTQFHDLINQMRNSRNYQIGTLDLNMVLTAVTLTQLSGIFDRLIVAEVQKMAVSLLTRDQEIIDANLVPVIW